MCLQADLAGTTEQQSRTQTGVRDCCSVREAVRPQHAPGGSGGARLVWCVPGTLADAGTRTDEASAVAAQPASSRFLLSDTDFNRWFRLASWRRLAELGLGDPGRCRFAHRRFETGVCQAKPARSRLGRSATAWAWGRWRMSRTDAPPVPHRRLDTGVWQGKPARSRLEGSATTWAQPAEQYPGSPLPSSAPARPRRAQIHCFHESAVVPAALSLLPRLCVPPRSLCSNLLPFASIARPATGRLESGV